MTDLRAEVAARELTAAASAHLTETVAMRLPFDSLGPFKNLLKKYFSAMPWTEADADELDSLVGPFMEGDEVWTHVLDDDLTLSHGNLSGRYELSVTSKTAPAERASIWDRVFSGPVRPEQTPHPRKVKFTLGGTPAPGRWYRRGELEVDDEGAARLLSEHDVTDVMVAGDFVTVGLDRSASWEDRLEPLLQLVTEVFSKADDGRVPPERTRQELLQEGAGTRVEARPEELHLLDPDDPGQRERLITALDAEDARERRAAVATLALSGDRAVAAAAIVTGFADRSRLVRRTAVDSAADLGDEEYRPLFERALDDADGWIRWKSVKALEEIDAGPSREALMLAIADPEFTVRFEAERVLRALGD